MYTLTILDSDSLPLDSVNISVKNKDTNKVYDLPDYDNYNFPEG
jgi:hypothetical protein